MEKSKFYDREFKVKAVQLGFEIGLTKGARELGINAPLMTRWRQEFLEFGAAGFCGRGSTKLNAEQQSFSDLKRKLKNRLKESELKLEIFINASKYTSGGKLTIYHFWNGYLFCHKKLRPFLKIFHSSSFVAESWRMVFLKNRTPTK